MLITINACYMLNEVYTCSSARARERSLECYFASILQLQNDVSPKTSDGSTQRIGIGHLLVAYDAWLLLILNANSGGVWKRYVLASTTAVLIQLLCDPTRTTRCRVRSYCHARTTSFAA